MAFDFHDGRSRDEAERLYTSVSMAVMALNGSVDQTLLAGFRLGLRGIDVGRIEAACERAVQTMERMPKPADLRRLAGERTPEQAALVAWEKACHAVSVMGPYKTVNFDDGVTNAVIRSLGGWPEFCGRFAGDEEEKWIRHEFLKAYAAMPTGDEATRPLPGLARVEASGGRVQSPRPRLVVTGLSQNTRPRPLPAPNAGAPKAGKDQDKQMVSCFKKP